MSQPSAAFFVNPLSHNVAKRGSVLAKSAADKAVMRFDLSSFDSLSGDVSAAAKTGVETVFIEGGDGTIHGVLTKLMAQADKFETFPNIVLLPGGMTNLIAANIGLKKPNPNKIDTILSSPDTAHKTALPLLCVSPENNEAKHYGFLFSSGALPAATQFCLDKIHTKGIGGATAVSTTLLGVLFGRGPDREKILTHTHLSLQMPDAEISGDHLTSVATTLPKLMIGINPFWGTGDGAVRLTHAGPPTTHKMVNIARMFKKTQSEKARRSMQNDGFRSWNIDDAVLTHDGPLILDGEVLPNTDGPIKLSSTKPINFLR